MLKLSIEWKWWKEWQNEMKEWKVKKSEKERTRKDCFFEEKLGFWFDSKFFSFPLFSIFVFFVFLIFFVRCSAEIRQKMEEKKICFWGKNGKRSEKPLKRKERNSCICVIYIRDISRYITVKIRNKKKGNGRTAERRKW